jgi:sphinganine-1-phosphate aldolase
VVREEIESLEKQLQKLTFISLILGVAILFYSFKLALKLTTNLINKIFATKAKKLQTTTSKKEVNPEDIYKLVHFQKFDNIELEFKDEAQDKTEVIAKFAKLKEEDNKIQTSKNFINGPIFTLDKNIMFVANEALKNNLYSNLLHPDIFCGSRFIESELIRISIEMYKGNEECCGISTYGGTESILLAMLAYRNFAASKGVTNYEILVPITGHAAFNKACDCFGIKLIEIPLNKHFEMDLDILVSKLNKNTICIAASYPNNINGVCDNITEIAKIALKHGTPFHVDAGLGGLLLPFRDNAELPKCDFTVKGITSISVDYHKYGLSPQGISVLMYTDRVYRKNHYFIYNQWAGGIYPCSGFPGSRTPAVIVSAFSVLIYLGKNYFRKQAKIIYEKVEQIKGFIRKECSDVEIVGDPKICLVAFKGKKIGFIYNSLKENKWELNFCYNPYGFQYLVTLANVDKVDQFLADFKAAYNKSKTYDKIDAEESKHAISTEYYDSYIDYMLDYVKN